jgi:hypothetical protein
LEYAGWVLGIPYYQQFVEFPIHFNYSTVPGLDRQHFSHAQDAKSFGFGFVFHGFLPPYDLFSRLPKTTAYFFSH